MLIRGLLHLVGCLSVDYHSGYYEAHYPKVEGDSWVGMLEGWAMLEEAVNNISISVNFKLD